jgi:hypothetical protein
MGSGGQTTNGSHPWVEFRTSGALWPCTPKKAMKALQYGGKLRGYEPPVVAQQSSGRLFAFGERRGLVTSRRNKSRIEGGISNTTGYR